jgi:hypothetical protein
MADPSKAKDISALPGVVEVSKAGDEDEGLVLDEAFPTTLYEE